MKIMAFNGSPRGKGSNTGRIVDALFRGMNQAGAETQHILLSEMNIKHCLGCMACWFHTPGVCVQQDEMSKLFPLITEADWIIYATPLYVDNVTGIMKDFMDRQIPLAHPHFVTDGQGESLHPDRSPHPGKKMMVVSCCGYTEISHFQAMDHIFQRVARNMKMDFTAKIYRTTGEMLNGRDQRVKPLVDSYLALVEQAGKEIIHSGAISSTLQAKLDAPMVPGDTYIAAHNHMCETLLGKWE